MTDHDAGVAETTRQRGDWEGLPEPIAQSLDQLNEAHKVSWLLDGRLYRPAVEAVHSSIQAALAARTGTTDEGD